MTILNHTFKGMDSLRAFTDAATEHTRRVYFEASVYRGQHDLCMTAMATDGEVCRWWEWRHQTDDAGKDGSIVEVRGHLAALDIAPTHGRVWPLHEAP